MAERLTECIDSHLLDNGEMVKEYSLNSKTKLNHFSCMDIPNAVYDKLGELEDILEKYDLEVEELDERIYNCAFNYIDKLRAETDRDTWKRACELACEKLADIYSHCEYELFGDSVDEYRKYCEENGNPLQNIRYCETKYFYQQAKKEGNNE